MSRNAEALQRRMNAHIGRQAQDPNPCQCRLCVMHRAALLGRLMSGTGPMASMRGGNAITALGKRVETARVAGAIANILDTELKRQHSDNRTNYVMRGETSTGSQMIHITVDGVAYNLTVTRART